jgi:hypothetical protein
LSYFSKKERLEPLSPSAVEPLNKGSHTDVEFALTDGEMESLDSLSIGRGYRDATENARPDRKEYLQ